MIVRILGEGQYRLSSEAVAEVNAADAALQAAIDSSDEAAFKAALHRLVITIRAEGTPLADDEFIGSDAIVPDADSTLEETRDMLSAEGLIPD